MAVIAAGQPAPEFSLARAEGAPFTRADLQGRRTLLVFYPFAFSSVCTDQLGIYNDLLDYDGDLYDRELRLAFLARLRGERRFDTVDALVEQMHRDVGDTRSIAA